MIFYTAHRTLHNPNLYKFHKKHHEYNVPIALAYIYSGVIEHIANTVATGVTYTLLSRVYPVHIFTIIIWLVYRVTESMDGHCGYDWPWAVSNWVPFAAGGDYHFYHHSHNIGNYGGIVHIFDTLLGTNGPFIKKERE